MTTLWEKIKKNVVDTINETLDKTEELTSVGRIKLEILQLEHQLEEQCSQLGKYVHKHRHKLTKGFEQDRKFTSLNNKIKDLEEDIRKKQKELRRIREEDGIDLDL
jgi:predicted  nucleic acid-binding Zn-ribbon protein